MTMNRQILKKARKLSRKYSLARISEDKTENGKIIWFAEDLDLIGCMAQGDTEEEARSNLEDNRVDFVYFLLEDGMDVPPPTTHEDLWNAYDKRHALTKK